LSVDPFENIGYGFGLIKGNLFDHAGPVLDFKEFEIVDHVLDGDI
jgi:hypothetical protein